MATRFISGMLGWARGAIGLGWPGVASGTSALALACPVTNSGNVGSSFTASLFASGGATPYTAYAIISGTLPPGITLNTSTGVLSGTLTLGGLYTWSARVTDSVGATATTGGGCTINVSSAPTPPSPPPDPTTCQVPAEPTGVTLNVTTEPVEPQGS